MRRYVERFVRLYLRATSLNVVPSFWLKKTRPWFSDGVLLSIRSDYWLAVKPELATP